MFESAIDSMDTDKWAECDAADRPNNFTTYSINRNHKNVSDTCISMMVALDDGTPMTVCLKDVKPSKDPLKAVGHAELIVDADKHEIIGIDIDGDIVIRKDGC